MKTIPYSKLSDERIKDQTFSVYLLIPSTFLIRKFAKSNLLKLDGKW